MAGRPKAFDPDEALARAVDVFWRQGYEATGVQELLDAMEINRGSMYDTFGSKHDLFLQAMRRYCGEYAGHLAATLESPGSPVANLRAMLRAVEGVLFEPGCVCRGCFMTNTAIELAQRDDAVAAALRDEFAALHKTLVGVLKRAVDAGEVPRGAPTGKLATFLQAVIHGMVVTAKAGATRPATRAVADLAMGTVVRGGT